MSDFIYLHIIKHTCMWHVFYRSIHGTVARTYNGTFNVCPLGISRELCEGVNRSVVVGSLNQGNKRDITRSVEKLFHVFDTTQ